MLVKFDVSYTITANISIDVIKPNLIKKNRIEFQFYNVIHFVFFIASMAFAIFYNMNQWASKFLKMIPPSCGHIVWIGKGTELPI